jgi:hypothetical protein
MGPNRMTRDDGSSAVPRWGTPRQWYLVGLVGLIIWLGTAALSILQLPEVVDFLLRAVGMLGPLLFFGGLGIGVTKSRQRDRPMDSDAHE